MKFKNIILAGISIATLSFTVISDKCNEELLNAYGYGKNIAKKSKADIVRLYSKRQNRRR